MTPWEWMASAPAHPPLCTLPSTTVQSRNDANTLACRHVEVRGLKFVNSTHVRLLLLLGYWCCSAAVLQCWSLSEFINDPKDSKDLQSSMASPHRCRNIQYNADRANCSTQLLQVESKTLPPPKVAPTPTSSQQDTVHCSHISGLRVDGTNPKIPQDVLMSCI